MLSSCHVALILVLLSPSLALIYAVSVYIMSVVTFDLDWYSKQAVVPLMWRIAAWIAALASCLAFCQEQHKIISSVIPVGALFAVLSIWLIHQTRKWDVIGGLPPQQNLLTPNCMDGKVVLVTGANTGIGKEITLQLVQLGATVIMACRNLDKAQQARREIFVSTKKQIPAHQLRIVVMDLTSLDSVRNAVRQIAQVWKIPQIHVLINNAGIMMGTRETSVDGYELVMHANHLGHFLLTNLLLPKLLFLPSSSTTTTISDACNDGTSSDSTRTNRPSGGLTSAPPTAARVINLTSCTYKMCQRLDLDDLFCEKRPYTLFGQYSQSKLANILFTQELARRYSDNTVTRNKNNDESENSLSLSSSQQKQLLTWAVHPGVVRTDVTRNMPWHFQLGNAILGLYIAALSKRPSQGAWGAVLCAASPDPPPNATYIRNGHEVQSTTPAARIEEDARRLWVLSERLVGLPTSK